MRDSRSSPFKIYALFELEGIRISSKGIVHIAGFNQFD
jgi:hypothetical protein